MLRGNQSIILLTIQKLQQQPTPFVPQIEILIDKILSQDSYDQSDVAEHAYNVSSPQQFLYTYLIEILQDACPGMILTLTKLYLIILIETVFVYIND